MVLENVREMWTEVMNSANRLIVFHDPTRFLICESATDLGLISFQVPKTGKGKKKALPVNKDRFISKMFLRGDSVIIVLRNPN